MNKNRFAPHFVKLNKISQKWAILYRMASRGGDTFCRTFQYRMSEDFASWHMQICFICYVL